MACAFSVHVSPFLRDVGSDIDDEIDRVGKKLYF